MQVYDVDSRDAYMVNGTNISPDNPASFRVDRFISQTRHEVTTHVDAVIHTLHGESYNYYSAWVLTITHARSKKKRGDMGSFCSAAMELDRLDIVSSIRW